MTRTREAGVVRITSIATTPLVGLDGGLVHVTGAPLPYEPEKNTAGRALLSLAARVNAAGGAVGFELDLHKGIALGSGMGGSAASAVAALVAANATLDSPLDDAALYDLAMDGEAVASGGRHGDNVGPCLLGGLVLAPTTGAPVRVPVPTNVWCALVHPHVSVLTKTARQALAAPYAIGDFVHQSEALALFLAGCFTNDIALVRRGLKDVLVEPRRASLIPGFAQVKKAALDAGALGASISGAGPSVFAWLEGEAAARAASQAMAHAFAHAGHASDIVLSPLTAAGARVESRE